MGFKEDYSFERRKAEAIRIKKKFVDRVPVVCQRADRNKAPLLKKKRYLLPKDFSLGQFVYILRQKINLSHEHAMFVFINQSTLPLMSDSMDAIYNQHHDQDQYLYLFYATENVFG